MMEAASSFEESVNCTGANDIITQKAAIFNLFGYQILAIRENIGEYGQKYGLCKVHNLIHSTTDGTGKQKYKTTHALFRPIYPKDVAVREETRLAPLPVWMVLEKTNISFSHRSSNPGPFGV
jgi:hypothetical protein